MIRFGLCCIFKKEPIRFRRTTAAYLKKVGRSEQLAYLSSICIHNARSLMDALTYCQRNGIGCFRVNSQILPLKTHPDIGYPMKELPDFDAIVDLFKQCGRFCEQHHIRTTFHPDQFILLTSPNKSVVQNSITDLMYQTEAAEWIQADVINIHGGGAYQDKTGTLKRLETVLLQLPTTVRSRLTLENDDRVFSPEDLYPVCKTTGIPMVYDVHHHRCLPDSWHIEKATDMAIQTWNREPLFHISSPINGWNRSDSSHHHDYINPADFPMCWLNLKKDITIEVEAKAKELAVLKLMDDISRMAF